MNGHIRAAVAPGFLDAASSCASARPTGSAPPAHTGGRTLLSADAAQWACISSLTPRRPGAPKGARTRASGWPLLGGACRGRALPLAPMMLPASPSLGEIPTGSLSGGSAHLPAGALQSLLKGGHGQPEHPPGLPVVTRSQLPPIWEPARLARLEATPKPTQVISACYVATSRRCCSKPLRNLAA